MDMTEEQLQAASVARSWNTFTINEQSWMRFLAGEGLPFARGWLMASEETRRVDAVAFGLRQGLMESLALRVVRHMTRVEVIPELQKKLPDGWLTPAQLSALKKVAEADPMLHAILTRLPALRDKLSTAIMELDSLKMAVQSLRENLKKEG